MLEWLRTHRAKQWIIKPAIISNVIIFVVDVGIWAAYKDVTSRRYTLLLFLINIAVSTIIYVEPCV